MKHGQKALVRLIAFLLSAVLAVILAAGGFGYWALVWREVARGFFILIGVCLVCPWIPGWPDRKTDIRALLHFGKDLTLTYTLGILSSSMDRLLIGRFFGPGPVALYRQPYQLVVTPINQFMGPLYQVVLPGLSILQDNPARYRLFYRRVVAMVAMLSMPLSVFLAVYAQEITRIFLGTAWLESAIFFKIFALGGIIRSVYSTIGFVPVSRGNSKPFLKLGIANSGVMVMLMFIGAAWGPKGVAIGEVATVCVMLGPWMVYSFRGSPVSVRSFLSAAVLPATASSLMGVALLVFKHFYPLASPYLSLGTGSLIAALSLILAWILLPGGLAEVREPAVDIVSAIRKRRVDTGRVAQTCICPGTNKS